MFSLHECERRMKNVYRYSGSVIANQQNIAEHGVLTASIFQKLCKMAGETITEKHLDFVMKHDIVETVTGDLLWPAKNQSEETSAMWDQIEQDVVFYQAPCLVDYLESNAVEFFSDKLWDLFKCSDYLEGLYFLNEKLDAGYASKEIFAMIKNYRGALGPYAKKYSFIRSILSETEVIL